MTVAKRNKKEKPDPELVKLADSLLVNYQKPEDLIGENGLLKQLTKMLVERALETEMSEHLGHGKSETVTNATGNTRNGHSAKTLQGEANAVGQPAKWRRQQTDNNARKGQHRQATSEVTTPTDRQESKERPKNQSKNSSKGEKATEQPPNNSPRSNKPNPLPPHAQQKRPEPWFKNSWTHHKSNRWTTQRSLASACRNGPLYLPPAQRECAHSPTQTQSADTSG